MPWPTRSPPRRCCKSCSPKPTRWAWIARPSWTKCSGHSIGWGHGDSAPLVRISFAYPAASRGLTAMRHTNVLVLGGSGFIGRYVCNLLTARGARIVVPTRRRDRAKHLIVLPTCDAVEANVMDDRTLDRLVA